MIAAKGLKPVVFALSGLAVAALIALVAVSYAIPAQRVQTALRAELRAATGFDLTVKGDAHVAMMPSGSVSIDDVQLGTPGASRPALTAERVTARLRLLPLLLGRLEIADLTFERGRFQIVVDADGHSNWSQAIERVSKLMAPGTRNTVSFSDIRFEDSALVIRDERRDVVEFLSDVDLSLAWPSISRSIAATGQFTWRGQKLDASASLGDIGALLLGQRSTLKLRVAGAPLKFVYDGGIALRPELKLDGALSADAPSLRQTLAWLGQTSLPAGGFGRFGLKSQASLINGTIALASLNIELDGNSAEGVLTYATQGRQTLQGTLASEALDLSPYMSAARTLTENDREWSRVSMSLDTLSRFDLDLRMSAQSVALSGAKLGRTAAAANLRGGKLVFTVGESRAFGGVLTGALTLAQAGNSTEFKSQAQFTDVELENCIGEMFGIKRLEGRGNLSLTLEGSGTSVYAITRTLNGSAELTARDGAIAGLNLEQLLRRLERRPLSGGSEYSKGRTPYDRLAVAVKIAQGVASVQDVKVEGAAVRLGLAGSASIPSREFDLRGVAKLVKPASANPADPEFELPFVVQGPWDDPILLPDPQILIKRSGAAAPLLDAVRDRRARDAVRSAIERLTGSTPVGNPVGAAQ